MYTYIYPLFLVTHSLIHEITQAIMHTYVTLDPQVHVDRVESDGDRWTANACASMRRYSTLRGQNYVSESYVPFRWSSDGDLEIDFSYGETANYASSLLEFLRFVHPNSFESIVKRHESDANYDWMSTYFKSFSNHHIVNRNRTNVTCRRYKALHGTREVDLIRHGTSSTKLNLTMQIPSFVNAFETIDSGPVRIRT